MLDVGVQFILFILMRMFRKLKLGFDPDSAPKFRYSIARGLLVSVSPAISQGYDMDGYI